MSATRLRRVTLTFPYHSVDSRNFFAQLGLLLVHVPGSVVGAGQVALTPTNPRAALPDIVLKGSVEVEFPRVAFEAGGRSDLLIDTADLRCVGSPVLSGEGFLTVEELCWELRGHVTRVDHLGINIPSSSMGRAEWERLLHQVGSISAFYESWEDKDWLFVLPATSDETMSGIQAFVPGREPKFELVYDIYTSCPLFQCSLTTDLNREEAEGLFPAPSGKALPGLGGVFWSVETASPWPGFRLRFDLYYRGGDPDWETGKMLVTQGRRRR